MWACKAQVQWFVCRREVMTEFCFWIGCTTPRCNIFLMPGLPFGNITVRAVVLCIIIYLQWQLSAFTLRSLIFISRNYFVISCFYCLMFVLSPISNISIIYFCYYYLILRLDFTGSINKVLRRCIMIVILQYRDVITEENRGNRVSAVHWLALPSHQTLKRCDTIIYNC